MAIQSYFFNAVESGGVYDRVYNAEDMTSYLDQIVGNGVFPNPSSQLQVRAGTGMNVIVASGQGWIDGHKLINTADLTLAVDSADVLLNRIDRVIFYADYTTRTMGIEIKKGTNASTPSAPALTRNTTRYEMALADIKINKQTTSITNSLITDRRGNSSLCGFVQGLIQQLDSTTLFQQWQDAFDNWFEAAQEQLHSGINVKKYEGVYTTVHANEVSFNVQTYVPQFQFIYDILEVYINGIHLNSNEYTLSNTTVTLETPISKAGQVVTFVVYQSSNADNGDVVQY